MAGHHPSSQILFGLNTQSVLQLYDHNQWSLPRLYIIMMTLDTGVGSLIFAILTCDGASR